MIKEQMDKNKNLLFVRLYKLKKVILFIINMIKKKISVLFLFNIKIKIIKIFINR